MYPRTVPETIPSADLDLRLVRYFTVVAAHQSFGRAADTLHVAQPSLSRQIQRLEHQVGARLLDRTPLGSRLTEAGRAFLPRAQALLGAAGRATAHARSAAEPRNVTVGYTADLIVTPAVAELRRLHPDTSVQAVHLDWGAPASALLDFRVDAVLTRGPFGHDHLAVTVVLEEPRALVVPKTHPLAERTSVTLADFADAPLVRTADPAWNAFWRLDPRPDGSPAPDGPLVDGLMHKLEVIASGEAFALAPAANMTLRRDLAAVPIEGIAPSQVIVVTRVGERNPVIAELRGLLADSLTR